MAVMAREAWTDERLDDLNGGVGRLETRMDAGFGETRQEFVAVRSEMKGEFQAVRAEMAAGFAAIRAEMTAQTAMLNQTIYRLFGGMLVAWVVGVIAIIAQT
jgi:phage host-nuclease inhibitor protein Gam